MSGATGPEAGIWQVALVTLCLAHVAGVAIASTYAPPLLDVTRLCDATTHHNVTAMSECVVAESEARSEILQKWDRVSDPSAQKCIKASHKAKRFPYSVMAKCLAAETPLPPPAPPGADDTKK